MKKVLASDFSTDPFGRYRHDDPKNNATRFREKFLRKWLQECKEKHEKLTLNLDGLRLPLTSSFMEETFGGIVRHGYMNSDELLEVILFDTNDPTYEPEIKGYIEEAVYKSDIGKPIDL